MVPGYAKLLAPASLIPIMLMLWLMVRDATNMLLLILEAHVASILLDSLLSELGPNLPALPLPHSIVAVTYSTESAFIIAKNLAAASQPPEFLYTALLAAILLMPLIRNIGK